MKEFSIQSLTNTLSAFDAGRPAPAKKPPGTDFEKVLVDSIKDVNRQLVDSDKAIKNLAAGKNENIHETMIAMEKASISFQMMMQMRNKIIEAYDQIMKLPM